MQVTKPDLARVLAEHGAWRKDPATGKRADLRGAYLGGANLSGAYLSGANLSDADLSGAYLSGADLRGADLSGAYLSGANLSGANLSDADLSGAYLSGANLSGANLRDVREDFEAVLGAAPAEVPGLRLALVEGRVNGSSYEGACACLVGTIANVRGCDFNKVPGLTPNSARPSERWFLGIAEGDTPLKSQVVKLTVEWLDAWAEKQAVKVAP